MSEDELLTRASGGVLAVIGVGMILWAFAHNIRKTNFFLGIWISLIQFFGWVAIAALAIVAYGSVKKKRTA